MLRTLLLFIALLSPLARTADFPWSAWRGPNRDGVCTLPLNPPAAWPKKLKEIWSIPIGKGYSSPISDGKTVYLQTRTEKDELLSAFNLADGKKMWETKLVALKEPASHDPTPTPAFSQDALYVNSSSGAVFRVNASDGKIVWKRDLPGEWAGEKFGPFHGVTASPWIQDNILLLPSGDKERGTALALNLSDGKTAWEQPASPPGYGAFIAAKWAGEDCVAATYLNEFLAFKKEGPKYVPAFKFSLPGGPDGNCSTPVNLGPGRVLLTGIESTVALKIFPGAKTSEEAWRLDTGGNLSTPVFTHNRIYLHNERELLCLDPDNGKKLSSLQMDAQHCALLAWQNLLVCRLHDGTLKIVDIEKPALKLLADYPDLDDNSEGWSAPLPIPPNRLILRTTEKLKCVEW